MNQSNNFLLGSENENLDGTIIKASAVYDVCKEFERARNSFLTEAANKNIELSLTCKDHIAVCYWDLDAFCKHVLNSILSNAIRYTPFGGKIAIVVTKIDDYNLVVTVSDSGNGIPSNQLEGVFKSGKLKNALTYVLAHKGALSIVDEPYFTGATFQIEMPLFALCIS